MKYVEDHYVLKVSGGIEGGMVCIYSIIINTQMWLDFQKGLFKHLY